MFLSYYGFREQPFGVTPDPRYLYQSAVHREALASLVYGIETELGFTSLIAEPGMGKTTLLYYLLSRYRANARTAFVFETQCNSRELLQHVFAELEISANTNDPVILRNRFKEFLVMQARARKRVLIIFDEAQNLSNQVLETVRLLSNFETSQAKLLHILLTGQPQLADKLARPELQQLRQRIAMFTRLAPFTLADTKAYIEHRLATAGYSGPALFTADAYELITAETRGIPREINRICFNALSLGCALQKKILDVQVLREVTLDLQVRADLRRFAASPTRQPAPGAAPVEAEGEDSQAWRFAPVPRLGESSVAQARNPEARAHVAEPLPPEARRELATEVPPIATREAAIAENSTDAVVRSYPPRRQFNVVPEGTANATAASAPRAVTSEIGNHDRVKTQTYGPSPLKRAAGVEPVMRSGAVAAPAAGRNMAGPARSAAASLASRAVAVAPRDNFPKSAPGAAVQGKWTGQPARVRRSSSPGLGGMPASTRFSLTQLAALGVLCPSLLGLLIYLAAHYGWLAQALFFDR
jgi:general secretion pathway protein A